MIFEPGLQTDLPRLLMLGVLAFPLAGLLLNLLAGKRWSETGVGLTACLAVVFSFIASVGLALTLAANPEPVILRLAEWIKTGSLSLAWELRADTLSVTMMLVVTGVGSLIHIYAARYMHSDVRHNGDPLRYRRFFVYFNLFILAMLLLVSANNFLVLFVGWEGVGLCSYLLIGFWFEKGAAGIGNARAAKKAFIVNRIGDFGLLIALFLIFWNFGSLDFEPVFKAAPQVAAAAPGLMLAITLFMLLGVTGKSAQLPLYIWLPDAMAGPTPVSALIHAATMVTAGVYLVARSYALYALAPAAQGVVMWVGAATALFAATIAVGQNDIKKVLAYSTISQLGFMVAAVGMGALAAGLFHLVTHAFFKALLFLSAGSVILGMEGSHPAEHAGQDAAVDPQDMRFMGGLRQRMPVTFWVYLAGALALSGIAPLAGFFSKDEILAAASRTSPGVFAVLAAGALLTAFYMGRQLMMIFAGNGRSQAARHAKENPALITVPLGVLAVLSVAGGALNLPGSQALEKWLAHTFGEGHPQEFTLWVAGLSLLLALAGLAVAYLIYGKKAQSGLAAADPLQKVSAWLFTALNRKWWVDELLGVVVVTPFLRLADFLANPVDLGVVDGASRGLAHMVKGVSQAASRLQDGYVRLYALVFFAGVVAILTYLVLH